MVKTKKNGTLQLLLTTESKNMGQPRPLFHLFLSFQTTLQILQQINVKKCPSSIRCWDSNSRPLEHESPPITTRPGLPPHNRIISSWSLPGITNFYADSFSLHFFFYLLLLQMQIFQTSFRSISC